MFGPMDPFYALVSSLRSTLFYAFSLPLDPNHIHHNIAILRGHLRPLCLCHYQMSVDNGTLIADADGP